MAFPTARRCYCSSLLQAGHRHVKAWGIDHSFALELHPNTVSTGARELDIELHQGPARQERMRVHQIDQVAARSQHVAPCSKIRLESIGRGNPEKHQGRSEERRV